MARQAGRLFSAKPKPNSPASIVGMDALIRGSVADRWLAPSVRWYTPQMVEHIVRDAQAGNLQSQWELFDLMEATWPRLQGNLKKLKEKVCAMEWRIEPFRTRGEKPSKDAEVRANALEDALWAMRPNPARSENDFEGLVFDILDAWGKGISVQEIYWERRTIGGKASVVPRATKIVPTRCYGYGNQNDSPDELMLSVDAVKGNQPRAGDNSNWMPFPPEKFLIAIAKQKSGHPAGSALLRCLGFFWAAQNFNWEWFLNFSQLFGIPIRWAQYSPNIDPGSIAAIKAMLAEMGSAGYGAFPAGTQLEILESVKASAEGPHERFIAAGEKLCDILILGQTLTTDVGSSGSRALGTTHEATLSDREKAVARFVSSVINGQLIPAWCKLNYGNDDECPNYCVETGEEENKKTVADTLEVAQRIGVKIPAAFAHERLDIPEPRDGEAVLEASIRPIPGAPGGAIGNFSTSEGSLTLPEEQNAPSEAPGSVNQAPAQAMHAADAARKADQKLADAVAESITGVEADWLGGAKPFFLRLISAARDPGTSDAEFIEMLEKAQRNLPEQLAPLLNTESLALAMQRSMGAAMVNGVVQGWIARKK